MEFDTAVARASTDEDTFPFTINERDPDTDAIVKRVECHAYYPGEGQVIVFMADVMGRRAKVADKVAGTIDFLTEILDPPSREYVVDRLLDRNDDFGMSDLEPIMTWLMEEWSGRPTKQPSDFAPSRKTGGQSSTRRTSKSTSSRSRQTAS